MTTAVYPGSFDPITLGHYDIIKRGSQLFDRLIVAVVANPSKSPMFTVDERVELIKKSIGHLSTADKIEICGFEGLLVDFMHEHKCTTILKGLRFVSDFEYEFQMALTNRKLDRKVETLFIPTDYKYSYLSSSIVKEVGSLNGDIAEMVPLEVLVDIKERINTIKKSKEQSK